LHIIIGMQVKAGASSTCYSK